MTGWIASKLTMNSQCTHWVSVPSPPVSARRMQASTVFSHRHLLHFIALSIVILISRSLWICLSGSMPPLPHLHLTLLHFRNCCCCLFLIQNCPSSPFHPPPFSPLNPRCPPFRGYSNWSLRTKGPIKAQIRPPPYQLEPPRPPVLRWLWVWGRPRFGQSKWSVWILWFCWELHMFAHLSLKTPRAGYWPTWWWPIWKSGIGKSRKVMPNPSRNAQASKHSLGRFRSRSITG